MEISVKYLPVVFIVLVTVIVIITLYDLLYDAKDLKVGAAILSLEKCVFRQVLNLLWITASCILYIKHRQVNDILNRYDRQHRKSLNRRALETGLIASFGINIIANFQENDLIYGSWIGVVMLFGFGAIYQCIQTTQYWNLANIIGQRKILILRMVLSVVSVMSFTILLVCAVLAYMQKKNDNYLNWQNGENGFIFYQTSVILKWVSGISTTIYVILFQLEFQKITLYEPDVFVEDKVTISANVQHTNAAFEDK